MGDKGCTEAINIEVGDKVLLKDRTTEIIQDKIAEQIKTSFKVYNFNVDDEHQNNQRCTIIIHKDDTGEIYSVDVEL